MTTRTHLPTHARESVRALVRGSALYWCVELQADGTTAAMQSPSPSAGEKALWQALLWFTNQPADLIAAASNPHVDADSRAAISEALRIAFRGVSAEDAAA